MSPCSSDKEEVYQGCGFAREKNEIWKGRLGREEGEGGNEGSVMMRSEQKDRHKPNLISSLGQPPAWLWLWLCGLAVLVVHENGES